MPNLFNFFNKRTPLSFKDALPRTIAPIMAASGAKTGFAGGVVAGALVGAFAMDDPQAKAGTFFSILGATALSGAAVGGGVGHILGYGGTNLLMTAFPFLKNMESRFLLSSGFKPQFYLFTATLLLSLGIEGLKQGLTGPQISAGPVSKY